MADSSSSVLNSFAPFATDPGSRLREWKGLTGRKIVGCLPMYVPEEVIHAAGMLPVVISGGRGATPLADARMPTYACSLVRGSLDLALRGALDFCDGFVFPYICDSMQSLSEVWRTNLPQVFNHHILFPGRLDGPAARTYLIEELHRFRGAIERLAGHSVSDRSLWDSIETYNTSRRRLARLYDLRRQQPGMFSAREISAIIQASMLMPKEAHNELLSEVLAEAILRTPKVDARRRLVVSGLLASGSLLETIEEAGCCIIDDDLFNGRRYFEGLAEMAPSPLESLAGRFLSMMPCPTKHDPSHDYGSHVVEMARKAQAEGVVVLMLKYCDPQAFDYPHLKDRLERAGIPHLLIESGHDGLALGQITTRVQAFLEQITGI